MYIIQVDIGREDELSWKLRAHMLPVFYQRSTTPSTSTVGVTLIQSVDHPSSSKLATMQTKSMKMKSSSNSSSSSSSSSNGGGEESKQDPHWPNGKVDGETSSFANVGLKNWHEQRAAWRQPKGTRRPPPPPVEYEAVIEGLSAQRVRQFQLPGWIGLTDLIDMYIDLWEMDY